MTVKQKMSYGHFGPPNQSMHATQHRPIQGTKLFHQDYPLHHRNHTGGWQQGQRPPPPNYSSSCNVSPPPSQVVSLASADREENCMCSSCSRYVIVCWFILFYFI